MTRDWMKDFNEKLESYVFFFSSVLHIFAVQIQWHCKLMCFKLRCMRSYICAVIFLSYQIRNFLKISKVHLSLKIISQIMQIPRQLDVIDAAEGYLFSFFRALYWYQGYLALKLFIKIIIYQSARDALLKA